MANDGSVEHNSGRPGSSLFAWAAVVFACAGILFVSTACVTRDPFKRKPSEFFSTFGSRDSHWVYLRTLPAGAEEKQRPKHCMVCRFHGEKNWVVKLNGSYMLYKRVHGYYSIKALNAEDSLDSANSPGVEPSRMCKVFGASARLVDVDALSVLLPEMDMVVVDDDLIGFVVTPPHVKSPLAYGSSTFRHGKFDLESQADTVSSLLRALN